MQSGNGIAEMQQQFMVDDCCSSFFPVSHNSSHPPRQTQMFQHLHSPIPIPITHQLFQHQQHFQALEHQQLHHRIALDHQSGCDHSNSPSGVVSNGGGAPFPFFAVNFKLGLNESSGNRDVLNDEDAVLRRGGEHIPESRAAVAMAQCWQSEEPSAIKEPFWKPLDIEYVNRNHKRCEEEKVEESNKTIEKVEERDQGKYGLFGELEAIYSRGGGSETNQRGSGSALTGENLPTTVGLPEHFGDPRPELPTAGIDHGSETSIGEEASMRKLQKRREKKRKQLSSIAAFFENLIKQLMDHQEGLHRKFLEAIERRDEERVDREEAWRRQEAAKLNSEAMDRAREQALASSREAAIVSYLEKITGQSISLPISTRFEFQPQIPGESLKEGKPIETISNSSRWPKAEVQALIRVRSSFESKFQEPGLKGALWEEISSSMASMGYERSAKRCKEKWENINKYFRKTKGSARKRSQHSKTCPYFHQLDHLYSRSLISGSSSSSSKPRRSPDVGVQRKDNSELLDAIIVRTDHGNAKKPYLGIVHEQLEILEKFKMGEMGSLKLDFGGNIDDSYATTETGKGKLKFAQEQGSEEGKEFHRDEENEDEDVDEGEEEEEEDENQEDGDDEGEGEQLEHE